MRILLLRHAKSSWDHPGLRDHDRPLDPRGERAAPAMGRHFAGSDLRIDRILTSTATRAASTARLFVKAFDGSLSVTARDDLYHADEMDLLSIALDEAGGDTDARVMLVGHNPGMHDLALFLCGDGDPHQVERLERKFPTGALAEFALPGGPSASELEAGAGRLVRFVRPKDLPEARRLRI
jgi:phosphohistidine phosphatase